MESISDPKPVITGKTVGKFLALILFLAAAVCLLQLTPARELAAPEHLGRILGAAGWWAPAAFVLTEATAIALFAPASILILLGAGLFGASWGFFWGWLGAAGGAAMAFFVGRTLGRGFIAGLLGHRLRKYDEAIERNGFAAVLYLRLLNAPFTPLNYALSLTRVQFRDFLFGTALGVAPSIFVLTFLAGALKHVWISGQWRDLVSLKVGLAIALFVFSLLIPLIIRRFRGSTAVLK